LISSASANLYHYWPLLTDLVNTAGTGDLTAGTGASLNSGDGPSITTSGGTPTITNAGDEVYQNGETGIVITGTNFGASQGSGNVKICPTDDAADSGAVTQTVTSWSDTSITITAVKGALAASTTAYLFVMEDTGFANADGWPVQFESSNRGRSLLLGVG
jgi:hypothetical protein